MPPRGVALKFILIPVLGSEVCVEGGVEQKERHGSGAAWVTLGMRKSATQLKHLEPNACAFDDLSRVRDTRKKVSLCHALCIRRGVLPSHPVA